MVAAVDPVAEAAPGLVAVAVVAQVPAIPNLAGTAPSLMKTLPINEELFESLWWWNNRPLKGTPYGFVFISKNPDRHCGKSCTERRWL